MQILLKSCLMWHFVRVFTVCKIENNTKLDEVLTYWAFHLHITVYQSSFHQTVQTQMECYNVDAISRKLTYL